MEPQNLRFGGGTEGTLLHPIVAVVLLLATTLILFLPRRRIVVPFLLAVFFIPKGQVLVIAGAHFTAAKILTLAALARCWTSRRLPEGTIRFNSIDWIFTLWAVSYFVVFSLQWMQLQALIKSAGDLLDTLGGYLVLRYAIQGREDVERTIKLLAIIAAIMAICMLNEQRSGTNVFAMLGGMPETTIRDGRIRSQGAFEVFITAGAYGATLLPLLVWLWPDKRLRMVTVPGMIGATVMTVTCYASTTLVSYAAGILALCFWPFRKLMRTVRWAVVFSLIGLHLIMHGPVWSLIEKIDLTGSSSSYHRYMLVDNCIRHFSDWWLLGTKDYHTWGYFMWDLSNQYVAYALTGGLITVVLFVALISRSFATVGHAVRLARSNRRIAWRYWCLGAALFAHVVAYLGIGYFDQMQVAWYALLAIIRAEAAPESLSLLFGTIQQQSAPVALGFQRQPLIHED